MWLTKLGNIAVTTPSNVETALSFLFLLKDPYYKLTFSHPEIYHVLTNNGVPQVNINQLNLCLMTQDVVYADSTVPLPLPVPNTKLKLKEDGSVLNSISGAMKLTRDKLLKGPNWDEWQRSEFT